MVGPKVCTLEKWRNADRTTDRTVVIIQFTHYVTMIGLTFARFRRHAAETVWTFLPGGWLPKHLPFPLRPIT